MDAASAAKAEIGRQNEITPQVVAILEAVADDRERHVPFPQFRGRSVAIKLEEMKSRPRNEGGPVRSSVLHILAFMVDLADLYLLLSFTSGSSTRAECFMVPLAINKERP